MTIEEIIAELERAHGASTQGGWRSRVGHAERLEVVCGGNPPDAAVADFGYDLGSEWPATNNAAFAVAAHNHIPALLAYVRALTDVADEAERNGMQTPSLRAALAALDAPRAKAGAK